MSTRNLSWLALVAAVAVGCGGDAGSSGDSAAGGDAAPADAAPVVDPATAATITGTVAFTGTPPAPVALDMSEEPVCADKYETQPMTEHVKVSDGNLEGVFVFVSQGLGDMSFPTPSTAVEIDQDGCRYHPHVLGIQTGQTLTIKNSDAVLHNINTQSSANRSFNVSQPQAGMTSNRTFNAAEVMIPVKCDVHGWMNAYIGVVAHPYYAVTAADGSFTLTGLPPGEYVIETWHETLGAQTATVTVGASETGTADFTYDENAAYAPVPMGEPLVVSHGGHVTG